MEGTQPLVADQGYPHTLGLHARLRPVNPASQYDPARGIPEFIVGSGGEALGTLAGTPGNHANANVVTAQAGAFGVMKFTLRPNSYSWDYKPALPGPGFDSTALYYRNTGNGSCH